MCSLGQSRSCSAEDAAEREGTLQEDQQRVSRSNTPL